MHKVLAEFFTRQDSQTILLLKPGELPDALQNLLSTRIGRRFDLVRPDRSVERVEIASRHMDAPGPGAAR